jgi:5'-3' exonuclease
MPREAAFRKVQDRIMAICDQIQTDEIRCYLTGGDNFRDEVATYQRYKGNRYADDGSRIKAQPKWLHACKGYIAKHYNSTVSVGEEADDLLGIAQTKCNASKKWHSIISTVDKDLRIIPGMHHDMNSGFIMEFHDPLGALEVDAKNKVRGYGLKFFYAQLLMGDSADWIPGLPKVTAAMKDRFAGIKRMGGCGPMAAYHVMANATSEADLLERALFCYRSYWDGTHWYNHCRTNDKITPAAEDMLLEQGRLLWIRQIEGEMWKIPTVR